MLTLCMLSPDFSTRNLETPEARKLGTFLSVSNLEVQEAHKLLETFNLCYLENPQQSSIRSPSRASSRTRILRSPHANAGMK